MNEMYHIGAIPADLTKLIFVTLCKRQGVNKRALHMKNMRHITKLIMRILINRAGSRIRPEVRTGRPEQ